MDAKKAVASVEAKPTARRLGRGLSSLMALDTPVRVEPAQPPLTSQAHSPQVHTTHNGHIAAATVGLSDFQSIPVSAISPSQYQPRKHIDDAAVARLAESIKRSGLMQPVIVRPSGPGRYELVAGERRWRAAQAAGLDAIPALVRTMDDEQAAEWGLVENVQREDLNPMERAWALRALADKFGLQQSQLAERVGLERSTVANLVRLCELEADIAALIAKGELTAGHGKALLSAPAGPARVALAKAAAQHGYSVRKLEHLAAVGEPDRSTPAPVSALDDAGARLAGLRDLERQIGQQLGTKVAIRTDRRGKRGKLTIEFYGLDHFDGLLARLNVRAR